MAQRVVLHTGLMKTGTSYLQRRLQKNRKALRQQGVLFPTPWRAQVLAASEVLGRRRTFSGEVAGTWDELVGRLADFDGTGLLSMEFFGPAKPERVRAVVDSLGAAGVVDVQVVMTLRDLGRGVPAMWQESLKNGGHIAWSSYVGELDGDARHAKSFWRQQGAVRIARNWARAVGRDHVTLVTVPPPGADADLLWQRFCTATGIEADGFAPIEPANESLGAASALVLRELNERIAGDDADWMDYNRVVKMGMAKKLLPNRRHLEQPIGYQPATWLYERSEAMTERLASMGLPVVGDLAELRPAPVPGVEPTSVPAAEQQEAALWLLTEVTRTAIAGEAGTRAEARRARKAARRRVGPGSADDDV